jgi:ATP adenylyltransferase/5',5'''-P-1,P-4-tetraphosphate phosphorylase II
LDALFDITRQMQNYLLFYNGPECGASAPDHLHFQAGESGFLPVEVEFQSLKKSAGAILHLSDHLNIWAFDHYLRKMISLETDSIQMGIRTIKTILDCLGKIQPEKAEPMVNLLCYYNHGKWKVHLFPRKLHRPSQFFAQGTDQLLISPASVDFGGVFITPRREDFDKITSSDIVDIFNQVSLDDEDFKQLKQSITN